MPPTGAKQKTEEVGLRRLPLGACGLGVPKAAERPVRRSKPPVLCADIVTVARESKTAPRSLAARFDAHRVPPRNRYKVFRLPD
jgi:hypothetical protein